MTDEEPRARKNPLGPTGTVAADNVKRLRLDAGLTFADLAKKLTEIGRPVPTLGLRKIEAYDRRIDADDLVALAVALGVSPVTLLMPPSESSDDGVTVTGVKNQVDAWGIWQWLRADQPLVQGDELRFWDRALPGWHSAKMVQRIKEREDVMAKIESGLKKHPDGNDK